MTNLDDASVALANLLRDLQQLKGNTPRIVDPASRVAAASATMAKLTRHYERDCVSPSSTPSTERK